MLRWLASKGRVIRRPWTALGRPLEQAVDVIRVGSSGVLEKVRPVVPQPTCEREPVNAACTRKRIHEHGETRSQYSIVVRAGGCVGGERRTQVRKSASMRMMLIPRNVGSARHATGTFQGQS